MGGENDVNKCTDKEAVNGKKEKKRKEFLDYVAEARQDGGEKKRKHEKTEEKLSSKDGKKKKFKFNEF